MENKRELGAAFYKRTTIILSIVVLIILAFFVVNQYQTSQNEKIGQAFTAGYNQGITDAVVQLIKGTDNCQPTSLNFGNFSRNVADVACLQQVLDKATAEQTQ